MVKAMKLDKITLGVCYYPEHWPETLWEDDLDRMLELGLTVIRIAEFAWNKFEPEEGSFTFDFFDRFLELAQRKGMKVIFCTPTATPPAWLTHHHPEVLNAREDGVLYRHGMRKHHNYNSEVYRQYVIRIVEKLAQHYCAHPSIIGWQIDNELNCETNVFYSEADHRAFREYLKNRFKTLEALNEAMGTVFWNQSYTSWEEIHLTRTTLANSNNPHLTLEEKRFFSASAIDYCGLQAEIIRRYKREDQYITTNGLFGHLDNHRMTEDTLDFITYDSYPDFGYELTRKTGQPGDLKDRWWSMSLMKVRSVSKTFGIMEQQSGAGGWNTRMAQPAPKPGQMRLWTYQSIAHGADFISYFRWRTCWIGTEIYWHGLNDYSNQPNRRLKELATIWDEVKNLEELAGAGYQAKVAIMKDYDNEWDGEQDIWHGPLRNQSEGAWFSAAQLTHTPMDFVYFRDQQDRNPTVEELSAYDLIVYPHATILTPDRAELLKAYVEGGGKLIMGARTGYKDEYGRCPMQSMPGLAADLCGVKVTDYTHVHPQDGEIYGVWGEDRLEMPIFNDVLEAFAGGEVLATYDGNYYSGAPALVSKKLGKGTAYYLGAGFTTESAAIFLKRLGLASPYGELVELPEEIELAVRTKEDKEYLLLLNYLPSGAMLQVKVPMKNMLSGELVSGAVKLEKYGVMILEHDKEC